MICKFTGWLAAVFVLAAVSTHGAGALDSAFSLTDVDHEATGSFADGKFSPIKQKDLAPVVLPSSNGGTWRAGSAQRWQMEAFTYRLAFKRGVQVGTMISEMNSRYQEDLKYATLKPTAAYPGDPETASDWQEFEPGSRLGFRSHLFEPGFETRAILISEKRPIANSEITRLLLLKPRLFNVTPHCVGQGQQSYGAGWPEAIPMGLPWRGAGSIGENPVIKRAPVSEVDPSWFILVREEGVKPVAMRFASNIEEFRLYGYVGDKLANPATAPHEDWERIPYEVVRAESKVDHLVTLMTINEPVETRALKMILLETLPRDQQAAVINEWTVWEDLGGEPPPPPPAPPPPPPVTVPYAIDKDAMVAMVVDMPDGTRARNLVAQVERKAGENKERWDLKDDQGKYLPVGPYKVHGIYAPPLELFYQHTFYPNVEMHSPDSTPWGRGPKDGWLGNHASLTGLCAIDDLLFIGSGGAEGGHTILACTLSGQKLWGSTIGTGVLFTDGTYLYNRYASRVTRMDPKTKQIERGDLTLVTPERRGTVVGTAAKDGKVYVAYHGLLPYFDKAVTLRDVDEDACLPRLPVSADPPGRDHMLPAAPREDFYRLLRLTGEPAGLTDPGSLTRIPSTTFRSHKQYVVVAFKNPMPIGSVAYPRTETDEYTVSISLLKPDATYPPNPKKQSDWIPFPDKDGKNAWEVLAAPENARTRAIRVTFAKAGEDDFLDGADESMEAGGGIKIDEMGVETDETLDGLFYGEEWKGELDGLLLMRRRFKNLFASAKVRVSSGKVNEQTGEWTAERTEFVSREKPAIYVMEWPEKQSLTGLALKEIDGALTEIDIYEGPDTGPIDIHEPEGKNWVRAASYRQRGRSGGQLTLLANGMARYLEGFVNFGRERETRAVRLRIVNQWTYGAGRRGDQGGGIIDHKRAAVYGVAPLQYIKGEVPTEVGEMQILTAFDWQTKEPVEDYKSDITGEIQFDKEGNLFGIIDSKVAEIDLGGTHAKAKRIAASQGLLIPQMLEIDDAGNLYVYDDDASKLNVSVFRPDGTFSHEIGKPGHPDPGAWDPGYMLKVTGMTLSKEGDFYVNYPHDNPRRTTRFKTSGELVEEFTGNTYYGGGGTLDRYDSSLGYYMDMVFGIDWKTHTSRIIGQKIYRIVETSQYGRPTRTHTAAVRIKDWWYHVSIPLVIRPVNSFGEVYLFDRKTLTHRFVAGVGSCAAGTHFSRPEFIKLLGGKEPGGFIYIFADHNGDGEMQVNEVQVSPTPPGFIGLGRFDRDLGIMGGKIRFEVKEFLKDGTPIYHRVPVKGPGGIYRLNNGNYFGSTANSEKGSVNRVTSPEGKTIWTYPATFDVSGLYVPPWTPGHVANQLAMTGHEVEEKGELGEFFVFHHNTGQWNLWTADGLLAGLVMRHTRDPKSRWFGAEHAPGTRVTGLTARQEHFHGFFCKREDTGKYHAIMGDDGASIVEVQGLDKFKRFRGGFEVTPEMMSETRKWDAANLRKRVFSRSPTVECYQKTPVINGSHRETEWPDAAVLESETGAEFTAAHNARYLSFMWKTGGFGPFKNAGGDFRTLFKTGAAVDVRMGLDPKADPNRTSPAKGDIRILFAMVKGEPQAVLYEPVAGWIPQQGEPWKIESYAGGKASFASVRKLKDFTLAASGSTVEATVALAELGLKPDEDAVLKFDWGVMGGETGMKTTRRMAWVNAMATDTHDAPTEARIHPDRWGYIRFHGVKRDQLEQSMDPGQGDLKKKDIEDIFDDIVGDL